MFIQKKKYNSIYIFLEIFGEEKVHVRERDKVGLMIAPTLLCKESYMV